MTQLEKIADAMLAALNTGRPVGVPVHNEWTGLAIKAADLPVATLAWGPESSRRVGGRGGPINQNTIRLSVEYLTSAITPTPVSAQRAGEPLRAWAIKKLEGNRLGGEALDIVLVGNDRKLEQGEVPFARTIVEFDVSYTTRVGDAEQRV